MEHFRGTVSAIDPNHRGNEDDVDDGIGRSISGQSRVTKLFFASKISRIVHLLFSLFSRTGKEIARLRVGGWDHTIAL